MMPLRKYLLRFFPFLFIIFLIIIFFNKTLIGEEMFVTPDWGQSDVLYAGYSLKSYSARLIKQDEIPFWNRLSGTGFPQFAVIDGLFNPLNFITYYFLPMPLAYNINLAIVFFLVSFFTYLYARLLKLSRISSLLASMTFCFSGIMVTKIVHISVVQTLAYFPMGLYFLERALKQKRLSFLFLLSFAVGFQMLVGFYQIILYTLTVYIFYCLFRLWSLREKISFKIIFLAVFLMSLFLGFFIGSVQLLPSWEFTRISTRSIGVSVDEKAMFPYPIYHLVTFIWPYLLGDPRLGTYPKFSESWGIFWENTGYIGILPLIFAAYAVIKLFKIDIRVKLFSFISLISFLLMLGLQSPAFFIFLIPPFSLFRVPARWIIYLVFSLCILASVGFEEFKKKLISKPAFHKFSNHISILLLMVILFNIFVFIQYYHLRGKTREWFAETQTVQFLKKDKSLFRIESLGNGFVWNKLLLNKGWIDQEKKYLAYNEALTPYWNTIYDIEHVDSYPGVITQRNQLLRQMKLLGTYFENSEISLNDISRKLYDLQNVKYIISSFIIKGRDLEKVFSTETDPVYYIYQNKTVLPRAYAVYQHEVASKVENAYKFLASSGFDPSKSVILEEEVSIPVSLENPTPVEVVTYKNQSVELRVKMKKDGLLVLSDAVYPSWKAYLDGEEVEILNANINQRAVVVPEGSHVIKFIFKSASFQSGAIISIVSTVMAMLLFTVLWYDNNIILKSINRLRR